MVSNLLLKYQVRFITVLWGQDSNKVGSGIKKRNIYGARLTKVALKG